MHGTIIPANQSRKASVRKMLKVVHKSYHYITHSIQGRQHAKALTLDGSDCFLVSCYPGNAVHVCWRVSAGKAGHLFSDHQALTISLVDTL